MQANAAVDAVASVSDEELDRLLEYVFAHRKTAVQEFLLHFGLPTTGRKIELRARVQAGLADGTITADDLIALLDTIEGWGNQHIYLYKAPPGELRDWKTEAGARRPDDIPKGT